MKVNNSKYKINGKIKNNIPSKEKDIYWITAEREKGNYPMPNENSGKWLVFEHINKIDEVWEKIKFATQEGLLGYASKVATAKENPNAIDICTKVICVYTYDYTDKTDVMRIRQSLRDIGIIKKIPYKTDKATSEGRYRIKGDSNINTYYE